MRSLGLPWRIPRPSIPAGRRPHSPTIVGTPDGGREAGLTVTAVRLRARPELAGPSPERACNRWRLARGGSPGGRVRHFRPGRPRPARHPVAMATPSRQGPRNRPSDPGAAQGGSRDARVGEPYWFTVSSEMKPNAPPRSCMGCCTSLRSSSPWLAWSRCLTTTGRRATLTCTAYTAGAGSLSLSCTLCSGWWASASSCSPELRSPCGAATAHSTSSLVPPSFCFPWAPPCWA
ncbi:uncharacterized protein LOC117067449 isoform X3 [Trachypithecus francoisi]|uniref:uncharacterized protein LOC117067449 isoform X3 n=1 Tax=Trachypithecus francoisi TaxID=54180 RepID=UPI00141BDEB8|nr:uncharacterized protein LOC117067449 isoform X3 [Trachypithecus francoisi]